MIDIMVYLPMFSTTIGKILLLILIITLGFNLKPMGSAIIIDFGHVSELWTIFCDGFSVTQ